LRENNPTSGSSSSRNPSNGSTTTRNSSFIAPATTTSEPPESDNTVLIGGRIPERDKRQISISANSNSGTDILFFLVELYQKVKQLLSLEGLPDDVKSKSGFIAQLDALIAHHKSGKK
jgi:hypothetical protein